MKKTGASLRRRLSLTRCIIIYTLLLTGCVTRYSKSDDGTRSLLIRDRDPIRHYLTPYFEDTERRTDSIKDFHLMANNIWVLINDAARPVTLTLRHDRPGKNGEETTYDFLLNRKRNRINLFRMQPGNYHAEFKRGEMIRRFNVTIAAIDL